ncbi:MAG: HU family DNA-binding protein [bacterium]
MNKKELVQEISKKVSVSQNKIDDIIKTFTEVIKKTLKKGEKVTLVGFGTFMVKRRKATTGINPQTKKKMEIPAKNYAKLQFSDKINEILN